MTDPIPTIVNANSVGREQRWPLPSEEESLLDLIHLCFDEYLGMDPDPLDRSGKGFRHG